MEEKVVTKKDLIDAIKEVNPKIILIKLKYNPLAKFEVYEARFDETGRNRVILKATREELSKLRKSFVNQILNFLQYSLQGNYPIYVYLKDIPATYKVVGIEKDTKNKVLTLFV